MSETKRYSMMWGKDEDGCIYVSPFEHLHGDWVRHGDYARLKADVRNCHTAIRVKDEESARLKAEVDKLTPKKPAFFTWTDKTFIDKVEFDKLQAENKRLKDELGLMHQMFEKHLTPEIRKAIINAAKEGKQS